MPNIEEKLCWKIWVQFDNEPAPRLITPAFDEVILDAQFPYSPEGVQEAKRYLQEWLHEFPDDSRFYLCKVTVEPMTPYDFDEDMELYENFAKNKPPVELEGCN